MAIAAAWGALTGEPVEPRAYLMLATTLILSCQWGCLIWGRTMAADQQREISCK